MRSDTVGDGLGTDGVARVDEQNSNRFHRDPLGFVQRIPESTINLLEEDSCEPWLRDRGRLEKRHPGRRIGTDPDRLFPRLREDERLEEIETEGGVGVGTEQSKLVRGLDGSPGLDEPPGETAGCGVSIGLRQ